MLACKRAFAKSHCIKKMQLAKSHNEKVAQWIAKQSENKESCKKQAVYRGEKIGWENVILSPNNLMILNFYDYYFVCVLSSVLRNSRFFKQIGLRIPGSRSNDSSSILHTHVSAIHTKNWNGLQSLFRCLFLTEPMHKILNMWQSYRTSTWLIHFINFILVKVSRNFRTFC